MKNTIMQKIEKLLDEKARKYGYMGTESYAVTLNLTDSEKEEFHNLNLPSNYSWDIDGNELTISYTEDIVANAIKDFFETETYIFDRGYKIHISRAPEFATQAVVEDADGEMEMIDVAEVAYEDFEEFLDAVVEKYENKTNVTGDFEIWTNGIHDVLVYFCTQNGESFGAWTAEANGLPENEKEAAEYLESYEWVPNTSYLHENGFKHKTVFNSLNELNSTIIEWQGMELKTTQDPYPGENDTYRAIAVDENDNEYVVTWEIIDPEITDESEICDWDNPQSVQKA